MVIWSKSVSKMLGSRGRCNSFCEKIGVQSPVEKLRLLKKLLADVDRLKKYVMKRLRELFERAQAIEKEKASPKPEILAAVFPVEIYDVPSFLKNLLPGVDVSSIVVLCAVLRVVTSCDPSSLAAILKYLRKWITATLVSGSVAVIGGRFWPNQRPTDVDCGCLQDLSPPETDAPATFQDLAPSVTDAPRIISPSNATDSTTAAWCMKPACTFDCDQCGFSNSAWWQYFLTIYGFWLLLELGGSLICALPCFEHSNVDVLLKKASKAVKSLAGDTNLTISHPEFAEECIFKHVFASFGNYNKTEFDALPPEKQIIVDPCSKITAIDDKLEALRMKFEESEVATLKKRLGESDAEKAALAVKSDAEKAALAGKYDAEIATLKATLETVQETVKQLVADQNKKFPLTPMNRNPGRLPRSTQGLSPASPAALRSDDNNNSNTPTPPTTTNKTNKNNENENENENEKKKKKNISPTNLFASS